MALNETGPWSSNCSNAPVIMWTKAMPTEAHPHLWPSFGYPLTHHPCCPSSLLRCADHLPYQSSVLARVFFHTAFCESAARASLMPHQGLSWNKVLLWKKDLLSCWHSRGLLSYGKVHLQTEALGGVRTESLDGPSMEALGRVQDNPSAKEGSTQKKAPASIAVEVVMEAGWPVSESNG